MRATARPAAACHPHLDGVLHRPLGLLGQATSRGRPRTTRVDGQGGIQDRRRLSGALLAAHAGRYGGPLAEAGRGPVAGGAGDGAVRREPRVVEEPPTEPDLLRRHPGNESAIRPRCPAANGAGGAPGSRPPTRVAPAGPAAGPHVPGATRAERDDEEHERSALDPLHGTPRKAGEAARSSATAVASPPEQRTGHPRTGRGANRLPHPLAPTGDEPRSPGPLANRRRRRAGRRCPAPRTPTSSAATPGRALCTANVWTAALFFGFAGGVSRRAAGTAVGQERRAPMCNPGRAVQPPDTQVLPRKGLTHVPSSDRENRR